MTLVKMFEHVEAGRQKVLDAARQITRDDFLRRKPGLCSIRDLLVHLMDAEDYWVGSVILGGDHGKFTPEKYQDVPTLEADWAGIRERTEKLVMRLSDAALQEKRTVHWETSVTLDVDTAIWHLLTHEIHHRGQVCMLIREQGYEPPAVDLL